MSSKVSSFQTEIENLNRDKAARLHRISLIDQRIDDMTHEENALEEDREKEILEAVRQIEERYRGRHELIKTQQRELGQSREVELEGLQRNGADLKKRKTALEHFQGFAQWTEDESTTCRADWSLRVIENYRNSPVMHVSCLLYCFSSMWSQPFDSRSSSCSLRCLWCSLMR